MNTKFFDYFGAWGGNTGFVIFLIPPSGEVFIGDHDPRNCFIRECRAVNTSSLKNGVAEVWFSDSGAGPFFCDVEKIHPSFQAAERRLSDVAEQLLEALQKDVENNKLHQRQLEAYLKTAPHPKAQQVAVPAREPLSDGLIDAVTLAQWGEMQGYPLAAHRTYARAIEAKVQQVAVPAEREPMTEREIFDVDPCPHEMFDQQRVAFARAVEAHHRITPQGDKA